MSQNLSFNQAFILKYINTITKKLDKKTSFKIKRFTLKNIMALDKENYSNQSKFFNDNLFSDFDKDFRNVWFFTPFLYKTKLKVKNCLNSFKILKYTVLLLLNI